MLLHATHFDIITPLVVGRKANAGILRDLVPASVMPFDTLHVFDEGWKKYLVNAMAHHLDEKYGKRTGRWLTDTLAMRFDAVLRLAFIEETKWPNPWLVFRGKGKKNPKGCSGLQACEMRAVFQLLPAILAGILGRSGADGKWRPVAARNNSRCRTMSAWWDLVRLGQALGRRRWRRERAP